VIPRFKIGDKVNYTNHNGVFFGERTITGTTSWYGDDTRYYIEPTDTPWYPVHEDRLAEITT